MSSLTSSPDAADLPSAWEAVTRTVRPARGTKRDLLRMSREIEAAAVRGGASAVLVTFQEKRHLTPATRASYGRLARAGVRVHAFARGLVSDYRPDSAGLVHVALLPKDPLVLEWDVVVLGARPTAFVARDLAPGSHVDDAERPFSWARTDDPRLVDAAAAALIARVPVAA
jgi:DICT domain-containing protein